MSRATRTLFARRALILLALLPVGLTWGAARVESRAQNPNWTTDGQPVEGSPADLLKKMEFLQQEVQELRGKVEEQTYLVQQLKEQQKKIYADLDSRIGGSARPTSNNSTITITDKDNLSSAGQTAPIDANAQPAPATNMSAPSDTLSQSTRPAPEQILAEEKAYQTAYRLIQKKDYDGAAVAFTNLVKAFPHGKYLPNAKYWLGEIHLAKGNHQLAYDAFDAVYKNYPQHPKAADCLLKLGYVEYAKGDFKRSESLLLQVKNEFPGSTSAQLADSRLERMAHEGHL